MINVKVTCKAGASSTKLPLVRPGVFDVRAILDPSNALINDDLPTFDLPIIANSNKAIYIRRL